MYLFFFPRLGVRSALKDGEVIINEMKTLLGEDFENYRDSFKAIHKIDPQSNPHRFLSHVDKYIGGTKSIGLSLNAGNSGTGETASKDGKSNENSSSHSHNIGSYTGLLNEDYNPQNCFRSVSLKAIYNENVARRKGCITNKSVTKYKIEESITKEDAFWLDSDLDTYGNEADNRIQNLIDNIINNCSELWIDDNGNKYPITPIGETRRQLVVNLGAVGCDNEGNINKESILLLGTKSLSVGNSTQLRLDNIKSNVALFPGQVIAVLGNTQLDQFNQSCLYAKEIIGGLPPKIPSTTLKEFKEINKNYSKVTNSEHNYNPVQVIIFSGPYTIDNKTLNYTFLDEILDHANTEKPHILLLLGPFLDARNEAIIRGDIYDFENNNFLTFEDVYNKIVIKKINDFAKKNEKVRIYILPSEYDINHHFPLPQPGLNETWHCCVNSNIYFLSNPCEIHINDFKLMVTSSDVITPISNSIITKANDGFEVPIEVVLSQFLYQRTLYPCYPVQHPINPRLLSKLTLGEELPHIFISNSSNNAPFVKPVLGRVFVNPTGSKQYSGVSLFLHPPNESQIIKVSSNCQNDDSANVPLLIEDRVCVDEIQIVNNTP